MLPWVMWHPWGNTWSLGATWHPWRGTSSGSMPLRRKGKEMHGTRLSLLRHCSLVNIAIPTWVGLAISQECGWVSS